MTVSSTAGLSREVLLARRSATEVWLARLPNGEPRVLKCATDAYASDRGAARLIEREWQFLCEGAMPGVARAYALERSPAGPGLVTEYLPNGDLVTLVGSHPRQWAHVLVGLAGTLRALHRRGIVHRDVKPRNVLFDRAERATLIDFASAAYSGARPPAGGTTSAYRAAWRSVDADASPAEDEYAFAAIVHELLAGRPPCAAASPAGDRGTFLPLCADELAYAEEPAVRALVALVNAVLGGAPSAEPRDVLAVFQAALEAIITTR